MNMILKLIAGALIASTAIAAAGCAKSGAPTHSAGAASVFPSPLQLAEDKMPRINVEEARKLVAEGKAVIIDVRGPDTYKLSHIKGALDVPVSKLETGDLGDLKDLPKDKRIIAYCA